MSSKKWTSDRIKEALALLGRHHVYTEALAEMGENANSVASAFSRMGLAAPTQYLARSAAEAVFRRTCALPEGLRTVVIANDFHVPFHNKNGVQAWLELCRDLQPEVIVINGDFLDCYSVSDFKQAPGMPALQDEIDAGLAILEQLRRYCPVSEIHYTEGNHEVRLKRMIKSHHGLYKLKAFRLEELLEFGRLNIAFKAYGDILYLGELAVYHGEAVRGYAGGSAKVELEKGGFKHIVTGHTHRLAFFHQKGYTGNRTAVENGGLYDITSCEYKLNPNWMNGFCIVHQNPATGWQQMNLVPMEYDGTFLWNNKEYGK